MNNLSLVEKYRPSKIEDVLERSMYASRWLMAPVYVVLSLSLAFIMIKVLQQFFVQIIDYDPATSDNPFTLAYTHLKTNNTLSSITDV